MELTKTSANLPALRSLTASLKGKLSDHEIEVIEKKYSSPQVRNLTDPELRSLCFDLVNRIHVITGWTIPADPEYIKILGEELLLKLKEDFDDLNFDEIGFAFRKYGITIKDWGKSLNLELVNQVLENYADERKRISLDEERIRTEPTQRIYTKEELDNIHRADVEAFYQRCLKGIQMPLELPEYYRSILIQDGYLHEDSNDLHGFFNYMIERGYLNIYRKE